MKWTVPLPASQTGRAHACSTCFASREGGRNEIAALKPLLLAGAILAMLSAPAAQAQIPGKGLASWYGEAHRGKLMANGKKFNPDKLTAASWFYPLGTRVRVTTNSPTRRPRSVLVTITDRGPARDLVREGRIIDLGRAAFRQLAHPDLGLIEVKVEPLNRRAPVVRPPEFAAR